MTKQKTVTKVERFLVYARPNRRAPHYNPCLCSYSTRKKAESYITWTKQHYPHWRMWIEIKTT